MNNFRLITSKSSRIVDFKLQALLPRFKWQQQCRHAAQKFVLTNIRLSHGQHTVINAKEEGKKSQNKKHFHFPFLLFSLSTYYCIADFHIRSERRLREEEKKEKWNPKLNFRGYISSFDEASLGSCQKNVFRRLEISGRYLFASLVYRVRVGDNFTLKRQWLFWHVQLAAEI